MANKPSNTQTEETTPWPRVALILAVIVGAVWLLYPLEEKITLGLDLQGGTHMELEVDLDDAVRDQSERTLSFLRRELDDAGVSYASALQTELGRLDFQAVSDRAAADEIFAVSAGAWDASWVGDSVDLSLRDAEERAIRDGAATQVRETIMRRIDQFGVSEPLIQESGQRGERLTLQLPGLDDVARAKKVITDSARLEFRKVRAVAASEEGLAAQLGGTMPQDAQALPGTPSDPRMASQWFALDRASVTSGDDLLADAVRVTSDEFGKPAIRFVFNRDAGQRFGDFTGENIGGRLAVVLDEKVVTAPTIQSRIFNEGVITGNFTLSEAQDLVLTLKSGALPAKVKILFESTVGPWLGKESIHAGQTAAGFGLTVVVIFMLVWYRGAGINAVVALLLNLVLVLGLLSLFGATLTLPGIAGLILTIGMAGDANVIIFERIKEELAAGRSPGSAVDAGFEKAFSAIVDANVTTLFAAFFLFNFGSGPIKGFGITLILGIAASMFTAIFVSRTIFDLGFHLKPRKDKLSIAWIPSKGRRVPFLNFRFIAAAVSVTAIAGSIGLWNSKGLNYGVDFSGGTAVVVKAQEGTTDGAIRERLAGSEFVEVPVQRFGKPEAFEYLLRIESAEDAVAQATMNDPEAVDADSNSTRLMSVLNQASSATLDLNDVGRPRLLAVLTAADEITPELAGRAADAILRAREATGALASLDQVEGLSDGVRQWLGDNAIIGEYKAISVTNVGPVVGRELRGKATSAVLWSLAAILVYIWFRFELSFGVGAIAALTHDVLITLGILCLLETEINISIIAALLTIVGYSLNDTIVVFDRMRENLALMKRDSLLEVMTVSLSQTLSRTLLTSGTTLFVTLALFFRGGPVLHGFALALSIGILVGTYSSIFVASPIVLLWRQYSGRKGSTGPAEAAA
jgi:protein-export membrane protein SecD/preprotein translocase SecF subunit